MRAGAGAGTAAGAGAERVIVLDTTVLVYAVGASHPLQESCRTLVGAIGRGAIPATTTVEVIQEFAHVRARRRGRADAAQLALDFTSLLAPLQVVTEQHLRDGIDLWRADEPLGAFDAVLAAAAMAAGATLVSADAAFAHVRHLDHVAPDRAGVARLIG